MIRRLLSLPPIAVKATARALPGGQRVEEGIDDGSRGAVVACGNVETDAEGTCRAAGRRIPLIHQEGRHAARQVEEVGTGSNAAVEEAAGGAATMP
jgi:hypothetical protein